MLNASLITLDFVIDSGDDAANLTASAAILALSVLVFSKAASSTRLSFRLVSK